ncbi:SIN3-HDAC complex-associated factor-like [Pecten maximus]|uniref:SIN3-HDAC complex-associated factor-like n=1 Tax=Pecten maximus TaxID=6579 RepID=UPI001458BDF7|nr:SIN3-HDAC complex-associated factor-like [Pecten maximus]
MFSFHKPKIYRSINGCCICRAKSSSSRFTDSKRYECEFEKCFRINEKRAGEICNACVLLVKRWKKLPAGTSRHWHHVVDARAGPGIKSTLKIKSKSPTNNKYKSPLKTKKSYAIPSPRGYFDDLSVNEDSCDKDVFGGSDSDDSDIDESTAHMDRPSKHKRKQSDPRISSFLDLSYWKKTQVCCGTIFKGLNGEVLVDPQLLQPCLSCRKDVQTPSSKIHRSQSTDETESNSSSNSGYGDGDSEFLDTNCVDTDSLPDSGTATTIPLSSFPCTDTALSAFPTPPPLAMEC